MALSIATARQFARLVSRGDFRAASMIFNAMIAGDFLPETITATAAQINAVAAGTLNAAFVSVPDAATYTVLAADSGKTHILPDFTASCTLTLPAAASGLRYHFIGKASAADAQNWVFTSPAPFLKGGVTWSAAAANAAVFGNGTTHVTMTVVTPSGGTFVTVYYDGTNWIVNGQIMSVTTPAFS